MKRKNSKKIKLPRLTPTTQLFAAIALFTVSAVITKTGGVASWEISLFRWVYNLPDWLHPFFYVVTQLGSILILGVLLIFFLLRNRYHILIRLLMTGTLAYLLSGFAKDLWGRARPNEILVDIINLDYVVRGPGFPSGHTALATALALTVAHYVPKKYHWLIFAWIVGVGISRMYLGIHFPMDIVGGFAIGWGSYALFQHVRLYDVRFGKRKKPRA